MSDYPYRNAESCLYDYLENLSRIDALRVDLRMLGGTSSVKAQQYDAIPCSGGVTDNVSARLERIEELEADILQLERRTKPVERLLADLSSPYVLEQGRKEMLEILRLRYLYKNSWEMTAEKLNMTKPTLYRRKKDLVIMAMRYMAL